METSYGGEGSETQKGTQSIYLEGCPFRTRALEVRK